MSRVVKALRSAGRRLVNATVGSDKQIRMYDQVKIPIFIVGCQRSGTTLLQRVLTACPDIRVHGESSVEAFSAGVRIKSDSVIRSLLQGCPEPVVVFKPLNDTQNVDKLLDIQDNARAIWTYRDFNDVVNSMVVKWGGAQIEAVRQIATESYSGPGSKALGERVSEEDRNLAIKLNETQLSPQDAAAFIWYLRNVIYFDLNLDVDPLVLLCRYEDTVSDPDRYVRRIFEFVESAYLQSYTAEVSSKSISKHEPPVLIGEVKSMCDELLSRIDGRYQDQLSIESARAG